MEAVLDLYCRDFLDSEVFVCLDETSKQLISSVREDIKMKPGSVKKQDAEYKRNGTANIFMLNVPLECERHAFVTDCRKAKDYAEILRKLSDEIYPHKEKIVLLQDNLNTHKPASLYKLFPAAEARRLTQRFEWHYTPKHGSWLNVAEIELSVLSRQCLGQYFLTREELAEAVAAWENSRNNQQKGVNWRFTAEKARTKLKRLYPIV
jgi:hypothetical protein